MQTNDNLEDSVDGQKDNPLTSKQSQLTETFERHIIIQQVEREIRKYKRNYGGQEDIKRWVA